MESLPLAVKQTIIGVLLLLPLSGWSQPRLPVTSPKYQVTLQVFNRLTRVFASPLSPPPLEIVARSTAKPNIIARYQTVHHPVIQLDEEVYDLCTTLGSDSLNALAVLLGHELTHHYEKHHWHDTFGIGQTGSGFSAEEKRRIESEADFYGCFYGELAGFATGSVFPRLLDLIYRSFRLTDQLPGYPSLEARKAVYQQQYVQAAGMMAVFRSGQFFFLLKEFEAATHCFEYLATQFPSREILNNAAASTLQQALILYTQREKPTFAYPVELDARSRLSTTHRQADSPASPSVFHALLAKARQYAEKARQADPDYVPAYVNLACIHSLAGNQNLAIGVINELAPGRLTGDAYSIRAIAFYRDGQFEKALTDFQQAQQQDGYLARYNLALYHTLQASPLESVAAWIQDWFRQEEPVFRPAGRRSAPPERINGLSAGESLPAELRTTKVSEKPYVLVKWMPASTRFPQLVVRIQANHHHYQVVHTPEQYSGKTTRGVDGQATAAALQDRYGEPAYRMASTNGTYWVYPASKIVFEVSTQGRVVSWFLFAAVLP